LKVKALTSASEIAYKPFSVLGKCRVQTVTQAAGGVFFLLADQAATGRVESVEKVDKMFVNSDSTNCADVTITLVATDGESELTGQAAALEVIDGYLTVDQALFDGVTF